MVSLPSWASATKEDDFKTKLKKILLKIVEYLEDNAETVEDLEVLDDIKEKISSL